jgi:adhesin HecA-like repeat protein
MSLTASGGLLSTSAGAGQGVQTTTGNLALTAGNGLTNAGTISSDLGSVTARVNGTLTNSGTVHAKTTLDLADKTNGSSENLINTGTGTLIADGRITAKAASVTNQSGGTVQGTTGTTLAATSLTNAGNFIASNSAGQSGTFTLASLTNSGTLQSLENLVFNLSTTLANSGKLLATTDLSVSAGASALAITNTSPGVIQAGNALTVTGSNATFDTQSGTLLGNTDSLTVASLNNSGTLQSNAGMTLVIGNGLSNSGTLLAKTTLSSSSASLSNTSAGTLQATQGATITTSGALANSGALIVSDSASSNGTLNVATLSNSGSGVIQSAKNLTLNLSGSTLTNASKIVAAKSLSFNSTGSGLTLTNNASGYLQAGSVAGDTLTLGGSAVVLDNKASANILGDKLAFTLSRLDNAGTLQGGAGASTLDVSGSVTNSGTFTLANDSAGSGTITAAAISNSGTLQSKGAATLNLASSLTNSNELLTTGALTVRGTAASYTLSNTARMQSGGLMDIKGIDGGKGVDITVGGSGLMLGGSMSVNTNALTVDTGGMISSSADMSLTANTLSFGGTTSRIVAATSGTGTASITLANSFSNNGAVHSGGNLGFSAPSITNTSTGGFSALNNLTLTATTGNITNSGALYAGKLLTATATAGTFTNSTGTGTIDSDQDISITANLFRNYNNVTAGRNITIDANTFRNEVVGGDTRAWGAVAWGGNVHDSTRNWYDFPDDYRTEYYHRDGIANQYFVGGAPSYKPQIIAANTLTIKGFDAGYNTGGILSGSTVSLTGNGGTFTNNDLSLHKQTWKQTWEVYTHWIALGPETYDDHVTRNDSGAYKTDEYRVSSIGAGIFATTLNAGGFALVNEGSKKSASTSALGQTGASSSSLSGAATGTSTGSGVAGTTGVNGAPAISFGGLVITLPSNPNGYFVTNKSPGARYLVETNPLFNVGSNFVGSDYMEKRYGYNPDNVIKKLGDANYEAYLIRQQLVDQVGSNLLKGNTSEADQIKRLMDQAIDEGKRQNLKYGTAPTAEQLANLTHDIVWMVEVTVDGQKVLAPVVYLAASTRDAIESGAVIAATDMNMDLTSLTNTGGTIEGSKTLNITSKGDITNTSGTIKGGNVSLTSTTGSIINKTDVEGDGGKNGEEYNTIIGKTGGIIATGDLNLKAKENITVIGANVSAAGDASLDAGKNITFDTIVDKTTRTTRSSVDGGMLYSSQETSTTTTEKNIGSTLGVGGKLTLKSGGDTTLAGTKTTVGGDLDVNTGGDFNILARQDKTTTHTESQTTGVGVGGGVYGTEKKITDKFVGTNFGSTLDVGGNANVKSTGDMTLQGSDLTIAGNAALDAKSIKVLDGLDEEHTTTRTETTTFLSTGSETTSKKEAESKAESSKQKASAAAEAKASAETGESSEFNLASTTVKKEESYKSTSVASNLKIGGNLNMTAKDKITVQGSNIEAGGDLSMDAKNVEVLAGRNVEWSKTETTTTKIGIYTDSKAEANAGANAGATGMTPNAAAGAESHAGADSTVTLGARLEKSTEESETVTHTSSSIKSGGNLSIKAKEEARFVGANVESGGDMNIEAKDITNLAAQDTSYSKSSSSKLTTGLYLSGESSADASAEAKAGTGSMGAGAKAETEAKAEVSVGLRTANEKNSSEEGSVTNVVSTFKSGGNLTRKATNTITDQGTQLEAGGNIDQSATTLKEIAAVDKAWKNESSESMDGRLGVYADANAGASAGASAGAGGKDVGANAEADASAGVKAKFTYESSSDKQETTSTITSRYKAGGSISSKTTESTTLIGTQFEAGKDITLEAKTLDYQAAKDTTTQSSSGNNGEGEIKGGIAVSGGKVEGSGSYSQDKASADSTTSKAGGLNAGGNITIKTQGDTRFEGTDIGAGKDVNIQSTDGSVKFEAAKSTTGGNTDGFNASLNFKASGEGVEGGASGGFNTGSDSSTTNTVVKIRSGGGLNVSAGKDVTLEGTDINTQKDTTIEAKGTVKMTEVTDTTKSSSLSMQASVELSKESQSGGVNFQAEGSNQEKSTTATIKSGGSINIKGGTIINQEADLKSKDGTTLEGKVENRKKSADVDTGYSVNVGIDVVHKGEEEPKKGSKTTDDIPAKKTSDTSPDEAKNKTTDDLPDKKSSLDNDANKPQKPKTAEEQATEKTDKEKTIQSLKDDKARLDAAMNKKNSSGTKDNGSGGNKPSVGNEPKQASVVDNNNSANKPNSKVQDTGDSTNKTSVAKTDAQNKKPGYMQDTESSRAKKVNQKPASDSPGVDGTGPKSKPANSNNANNGKSNEPKSKAQDTGDSTNKTAIKSDTPKKPTTLTNQNGTTTPDTPPKKDPSNASDGTGKKLKRSNALGPDPKANSDATNKGLKADQSKLNKAIIKKKLGVGEDFKGMNTEGAPDPRELKEMDIKLPTRPAPTNN